MVKDNYKVLIGVFLIGVGVSIFLMNPSHVANSESFEDEPVQVIDLSSDKREQSKIPNRIVIPSLLIDLPVKTANIINGYWEVFDTDAAWGKGSGIPGEIGNTVIFAHAKKNMFAPLKDIQTGSQVIVYTSEDTYIYIVDMIEEVSPKNTTVIGSTQEEVLTLYTCSGYKDSKRFIVKAKRS